MTAPDKIINLVERFDRNLEAYKQGKYNETQVRREFIDPFFKVLGWDVNNEKGYAEAYKDVVHEDAIKVGGATKAPDYSFRIGGVRKFFVEAKKPLIDIKAKISPAYQLRRYAWSSKLPLSILTDFEEFAVYDCRIKPIKTDKSSKARVIYMTYEEYAQRWEELATIFSREAILKGSFDKYVESNKAKRGTAEVDAAFLQEIERWRDLLARNIALRNPELSQRELNFAVQRTIDRAIFLRICEDRGIEPYGALMDLQNGNRTYQRLLELFRRADERYNSGLFHFRVEKDRSDEPDTLTPDLSIDDKVLKKILKNLYYPDSPYEFSVLPADILGQVYEQFLGKVIRLTPKHRAVVEDKPEVKKAGGVYYTPTYIVNYIVEQTVGKLVEGKKPGPRGAVSKLKLLDPACGSGSFLLGAYQFLLDWHRAQYTKEPQRWTRGRNPRIYQTANGEWKLTIAERKRILLNNIYGVDIDSQAVEVTKLSLLLKVLEGENAQQLELFQERVLPDLGNNIKCGNSLISSDFYDGRQMTLLDEEELYRINVFDWETEFPKIIETGGFDAVIGNPPYVLLQDEFRDDTQLSYFRSKFSTASYKVDTYHLFIEQGIKLTRRRGRCSMITPANFLTNNYLASLRRFMLENSSIDHILIVDEGVFRSISVDNAIFVVIAGQSTRETFRIIHVCPESGNLHKKSEILVPTDHALNDEYVLFTGTSEKTFSDLLDRVLEKSVKLGTIAHVNFGKQLRNRKKFTTDVIHVANIDDITEPYKPCYTGRDVSRYLVQWSNLTCLDDRVARRGGCWNADRQNAKNKLLTRQIGQYPEFAMDYLGYQCLNTMFMVNIRNEDVDPHFVLGVLNSKIIKAIWLDQFYDQRRTFPKIKGTYLKQLPVYAVDFSDPDDKARHAHMVDLVAQMLELHKKLADAKVPQLKTVLKRQIETTDHQIDHLVYELYDLTEAEIEIVEDEGK